MKVTREADYAMRIMRCLAQKAQEDGQIPGVSADNCGGRLDSVSISRSIEVPQRFTSKILRKLTNGGLIVSHKGASGGYRLARPAEEITVREIIELIDGPVEISRCLNDSFPCTAKENHCAFREMFCEINRDIARRLEATRLSDSLTRQSK